MPSQPIKVKGHSLIDYGFLAGTVGVPAVLGLKGRARVVASGFGATQGALNALTDQPYAVRRVIPFKLHGRAEAVALPGLAAAVIASGALSQPRAKPYFGGLLTALATVYTLTDWEARTAPSAKAAANLTKAAMALPSPSLPSPSLPETSAPGTFGWLAFGLAAEAVRQSVTA